MGIGGDIGRGVANALPGAGFRVAASADEPAALDAARAALGPAFADSFAPLLGYADDPGLVGWTIGELRPDLVILAPSADEETAAQVTFLWCREVIISLLADSTTIGVSDHSVVRALVEDAARQPEPAARFGIRFLSRTPPRPPRRPSRQCWPKQRGSSGLRLTALGIEPAGRPHEDRPEATADHMATKHRGRLDWTAEGAEVFTDLSARLCRRPSAREFQHELAAHTKMLITNGRLAPGTRPPSIRVHQ